MTRAPQAAVGGRSGHHLDLASSPSWLVIGSSTIISIGEIEPPDSSIFFHASENGLDENLERDELLGIHSFKLMLQVAAVNMHQHIQYLLILTNTY